MPLQFFGTSGIRGLVGTELSPPLVTQIGLAIATYTRGGRAVVGHDTRTSSPMIEAALVSGLMSGGSHVQKLGLTPTPVLAYLTKTLEASSGVVVTASHNPPEFNGVKIFNRDSVAYNDDQQMEIEQIIKRKNFQQADWEHIGCVDSIQEGDRYIRMVLNAVKLRKRWRIVLDCGCGATCHIAPTIFRKLNCKVTTLHAQPDGFFPGRSPEPKRETLGELCGVVKQLKADLGIAYDGDGDRMIVVNEVGEVIHPDQMLAAYAAYVVKRKGGGAIVTHVDASRCIEEAVRSRGGEVVRTSVGDVNIAIAIKKRRAIFGGEPVGSWIHPQFHFCPDGILSSALLLQALEDENKTVSQFISNVHTYPLLREAIPCPNGSKRAVMRNIEEIAPTFYPNIRETLKVDGLRFELPGGWVVIRPSGTEPIIRVSAEAKTKKRAEKLFNTAIRIVEKALKEAKS